MRVACYGLRELYRLLLTVHVTRDTQPVARKIIFAHLILHRNQLFCPTDQLLCLFRCVRFRKDAEQRFGAGEA